MTGDLDWLWFFLLATLVIATADDCAGHRANIREMHCPTMETGL